MRPRANEFGVFPKNRRGTIVYYYWVYDKSGKRKFRTTGKRNFEEAVRYCRTLLIKGQLYQKTSTFFGSYTKDFFDYDKCPYIHHRLSRGYSYGRPWARRQRALLDNVIGPFFNERNICEITVKDVDDFIQSMKEKGHGAKTMNHIITTLKNIFSFAVLKNDIEDNPCNGIKPFKINSPEKGILTEEEFTKLFDEKSLGVIWPNKVHFAINYLAATTGMRLGEIQALCPQDISERTITVSHSYNSLDGLKGTKSGKTRKVPIQQNLNSLLMELAKGIQPNTFIFSANGGSVPLDHKVIYHHFWQALEKIGIDKSERRRRNISFHSFRHGFCTRLLESGITPETVRLLLGHTPAMTVRYSHVQLAEIFDEENVKEKYQTKETYYRIPAYIDPLVDKGLLLPDGRTVVKSLDAVAEALIKQNIQPTEVLLCRMFVNRNGKPYSIKACKQAVCFANTR
jgi:site-specific recombinase XerD